MHFVMESQFFLFLLAFVPCFVLLRMMKLSAVAERSIAIASTGAAIVCLMLMCFFNLKQSDFAGHDEANVAAVAAAYLTGHAMYHAQSAPEFYAQFYGPLTFLVYTVPLLAQGHAMQALRAVAALLALVNFVLFYGVLRLWLPRVWAAALLVFGMVPLVFGWQVFLGTRCDTWLLLCMSAGVLFTARKSWLVAAMGVGVCCGAALDFKISIVPVVCLLLAMLWRRHGARAAVVAAVFAAVIALSVFLLPGISLANYLAWLKVGSRQALLPSIFVTNLLQGCFMVAGAVLVGILGTRKKPGGQDGWVIPLLGALALLACMVTGAKDGAGVWHLWPMLPFVLAWMAYAMAVRPDEAGSSRTAKVALAICLASTLVTVRFGYRGLAVIRANAQLRGNAKGAEAEMRELARRFPSGRLAMGYGLEASDTRSSLRFEMPLLGETYFLDENAVVESVKEKMPVPRNVVDRVNGCGQVWLIPRGEAPFSSSRKDLILEESTPYLFPDEIRLGFPKTHVLTESLRYYDLWACPESQR